MTARTLPARLEEAGCWMSVSLSLQQGDIPCAIFGGSVDLHLLEKSTREDG